MACVRARAGAGCPPPRRAAAALTPAPAAPRRRRPSAAAGSRRPRATWPSTRRAPRSSASACASAGKSRQARRRVVRIEGRRGRRARGRSLARVRADRKGAFTRGVAAAPHRRSTSCARGSGATAAAATAAPRCRSRSAPRARAPSSYLTVYEPAIATWYGPGFFGRTDRLRHRADRGDRRRRAPRAALRDPGADRLQDRTISSGDRPRAVRERRRLGPHPGRRPATWHDGY